MGTLSATFKFEEMPVSKGLEGVSRKIESSVSIVDDLTHDVVLGIKKNVSDSLETIFSAHTFKSQVGSIISTMVNDMRSQGSASYNDKEYNLVARHGGHSDSVKVQMSGLTKAWYRRKMGSHLAHYSHTGSMLDELVSERVTIDGIVQDSRDSFTGVATFEIPYPSMDAYKMLYWSRYAFPVVPEREFFTPMLGMIGSAMAMVVFSALSYDMSKNYEGEWVWNESLSWGFEV